MSDLNTAQLARLRRFEQLQLVESWVELPATEHESVRVAIHTTGDDAIVVNRVHLDVYLTGLAHGSWAQRKMWGGATDARWMRSVLSERGSVPDVVAVVFGIVLGLALSVLWWGWVPLLIVGGIFALSLAACVFASHAAVIADAKARRR